ncbi:aminoacyl--tRNA ligase-related protein [Streptomyces sp. NBC_00239]|uniref:aminoacyl--tRNA ligase-related protein n=1 Tax=Streptomyces sp. NBC_00239 TaxID=2903640 RepID=UPI002E2884F1|nr:aminoacyl--tRNA ligase-related protein [Streptomyces sp. NBC_00239]
MRTSDPGLRAPVDVTDGLVTLGPEAVRLRTALDAVFTGWAAAADAAEVLYPPLIPVADLARFDYFTNFPHLVLAAAPVNTDAAADLPTHPAEPGTTLGGHQLAEAGLVLPSAACYNAYLSLSGARLDEPVRFTTIAQCFRRETHYEGLRRLHGFTMREIIAVGDAGTVKDHLTAHKALILDFAAHVGLDLTTEVATDPFFDANGSRAVMQRLFPTKEEFVADGGLAIASVNYHRNFFGDRADIAYAGEQAHTSCVAFGIERWLHVLAARFDGDWDAAEEAVRSYPAGRQAP